MSDMDKQLLEQLKQLGDTDVSQSAYNKMVLASLSAMMDGIAHLADSHADMSRQVDDVAQMISMTGETAASRSEFEQFKTQTTVQCAFEKTVIEGLKQRAETAEARAAAYQKILDGLTERIEELEENPSIVWLLRYKTRETLLTLITVFVFLMILYFSNVRDQILAIF